MRFMQKFRMQKEDPEWSLEDARFSAIVYKPSDVPNASILQLQTLELEKF